MNRLLHRLHRDERARRLTFTARGDRGSARRDTGDAASSGKVTLMQEIDPQHTQSGFLIYVPLYDDPGVPATIERRRESDRDQLALFRRGDQISRVSKPGRNNRAEQ